jgi:predicted RNA-binding protein YlqC (UPF0109 family)
MEEFAKFLLTSLAENPKAVTISAEKEGNILKLKAKVSDSDRGRIIGKKGEIIRSIRTVLAAAGLKKGIRVFLELQ